MSKFCCTIFLSALFAMPLSASERQYETPITAALWTFSGTPSVCHLVHEIDHFGEAHFEHKAGYDLTFALHTEKYRAVAKDVTLKSFPPKWNHEQSERRLGSVETMMGAIPIVLGADLAKELLNELADGMFPAIEFNEPAFRKVSTRASISSVRFIPAFEQFIACRTELLPFKVDSVDGRTIYYAPKDNQISQSDTELLELAAKYAMTDPTVKGVRISSYTGDLGGVAEQKRFKKRSGIVSRSLQSQGMPEHHIIISQGSNLGDIKDDPQWVDLRLFGPDALSLVHFDSGQYALGARSRTGLDMLIKYFKVTDREGHLGVNGHTDNVGRRYYNRGLSARRAQTVQKYLISKGVKRSHLSMSHLGERKPIARNGSRAGRALNRRVQIKL